jgi:hypothetical protein
MVLAAADHLGSGADPARKTVAELRPVAHNEAVRGWPTTGALAILLTSAVTACTGGVQPAQQAKQVPLLSSPAPQHGEQALGVSGCHPASPITRWQSFLPQVEGAGHGATLWGLLMFPHPLPARVGDQEKIVWRMTGTGMLTLAAISPDGKHHRLAWGPDAHSGSNWDKPGDEWGAGYVFTTPGCWDLRAIRGDAIADAWIQVVTR